ncbi:putative sodium P-type ATPase [Xylaria digitata]|nr:putative sodium P-type ATPase [Xylaria digitata]
MVMSSIGEKQSGRGLNDHVSGQCNKPLSLCRPMLSPPTKPLPNSMPTSNMGSTQTRQQDEPRSTDLTNSPKKKGVQPLRIFFEQIFNAMTLILALAASFAIEAWIPGGILGGLIVINTFIGYFQTLQAEKTIDSLRTLGTPTCQVYRGGRTITVQTSEVVPGDILDLSTSDSVPPDIRLVEATNLEADEAPLTGESVPTLKNPKLVFNLQTGPGDRLNVVFGSTIITKGRGRGIVFATGMSTEIGLIATALNETPKSGVRDKARKDDGREPSTRDRFVGSFLFAREKVAEFFVLTVGTPLQKKLPQLFLFILGIAILCAIIVLAANKFGSRKYIIIYAITTAIGTIPVSLLLVLTLTMAAGTKKMLERLVIVRNLSSLEAIGGVTNVCSDKTGTITQGRMITHQAWISGVGTYSIEPGNDVYDPTAGQATFTPLQPIDMTSKQEGSNPEGDLGTVPVADPIRGLKSKPFLEAYLNVAAFANLATLKQESGSWQVRGAPTEIAIEVFARSFGWDRAELSKPPDAQWREILEFPFDSDVKRMSVIYEVVKSQQQQVFAKGAVERVLDNCEFINAGGEVQPLSEEGKRRVLANMEVLASQDLKVLAFAHKPLIERISDALLEKQRSLQRDGFEKDLIFLGLIGIYDPPRLESKESVRMCQQAGITVHMLTGDHPQTARATAVDVGILPSADKLGLLPADIARNMIDELPELPLVVTRCALSDDVNDSPSLRRANIGITMGTGSDVAKESSDIILTDDNFASILNAIEEGRRVFDNIQKFILHVLAANISFIIALLVGLAFMDEAGILVFLLSPVEIIWMLLGTGAFCETGLDFEKAVPDILNRPPQDLKYGVFTPEFLVDMVSYGILMGVAVLATFATIIFGFYDGNLGMKCNEVYSPDCQPVFRARAATFAMTTWIFVILAWELIDFCRSFFSMPKGFKAWANHLWGNPFLFYSVTVVFVSVFPTIYIPAINRVVFLHDGITWEWVVVFISTGLFVAAAEAWK